MQNGDVKLIHAPLDVQVIQETIASDAAGGTCVFIGTVRDATRGKAVRRLEFEAYEPMAVAEMQKIAEAAYVKWPVLKVVMHHRIGVLGPGEIPVVIAVSAAHRQAAFEACQYCIDTLKQTVPIWKKEIFEDGEAWVSAHP